MRRWLFAASALVAVSVMVAACGVGNDCDFGLCAGPLVGSDGGDGGTDGPPVVPTDCDLGKSPKDSKPCVDDTVGIFVDRNGKPGAAGTMKDPVPSIVEGIAKATTSQRTRVYICDGKYDEAIRLTSTISLYGGFDCLWGHNGIKPRITSPRGAALEFRSIPVELTIEDIDATGSSDTNVKGSSAIAALVVGSKITFRRVFLSAGPGQDGAKGPGRTNYTGVAASGSSASGTTGGADKTCTCADGTKSVGGHGADGNGTNETDGTSLPAVGVPNGGGTMPSMCGPGLAGAQGDPPGLSEPIGAPGLLNADGWDIAKLGEPGKNGKPGQGGGGGGAKTTFLTPGGGGGCGGCGGAGGAPGANGGASIALISLNSTVIAESGAIASSIGGKGGAGGDGESGQSRGGAGGSGGCEGGAGGAGAGGAGGPGGAGGDSFGIVWSGGSEPGVVRTELKAGTGGKPGDGGGQGAGAGKLGPSGKSGIAGRQLPTFRQQ